MNRYDYQSERTKLQQCVDVIDDVVVKLGDEMRNLTGDDIAYNASDMAYLSIASGLIKQVLLTK